MINDPLLNSTRAHQLRKDSPVNTERTTPTKPKAKRRPPARSAKILTFGLSTTAMLGMTAGYALADLAQKNNAPTPDNVAVDASLANIAGTTTPGVASANATPTPPVAAPARPSGATPNVADPTQSVQAQTPTAPQQNVVIEIPTPQTSGATSGNGNSSWNNQQSSGSK